MGCATTKEILESKIMMCKIQKAEISKEREEKIKAYEKITGERLFRKSIPNYYIDEKKKEKSGEENKNNLMKRNHSSKKSSFHSSNMRNTTKITYIDPENITIDKRVNTNRKYSSKKAQRIKEENDDNNVKRRKNYRRIRY